MNRDRHLEKARTIIGALAKLDSAADALAVIDGTMIAGYHLGSAALHAHGVTPESVHYNTPSKFEVARAALPEPLKAAYDVFEELEAMRSRYVRSPEQPGSDAAQRARVLLERLAALCGAGAKPAG
jgi:hypothetical protein